MNVHISFLMGLYRLFLGGPLQMTVMNICRIRRWRGGNGSIPYWSMYLFCFFVTTDLAGFETPLPALTTVSFPGVDCTLIRHTGVLEVVVVADCPVSIRLELDGRGSSYIFVAASINLCVCFNINGYIIQPSISRALSSILLYYVVL